MRTLLISGIFLLFIVVQLMRGEGGKHIIDGDGSGYYAYLSAVFVHKTTDFTPVFEYEKSRRSLDYTGHYFHEKDGVLVNKYFLGTALFMLPFFLLALLYSLMIGMPPDGYTFIFQYAVALAAASYVAGGLLLLNRLLQSFGLRKQLSLFMLLFVLFGTNLFYYTFLHPSHSHAYSFTAIALFLYAVRMYFLKQFRRRYFYMAVVALALLALIRPTNMIIVLAIPFMATHTDRLRQAFRQQLQQPKALIVAALLFIMVFGIQFLFNIIQTGGPLFYSYRNEGFHFLRPALIDFLFSYRKGFFVYTPFMLLLLPALWFLWKKSRYMTLSFAAFFLVLVYFLSSWWNWFYGDSFGMRPMIDFYALFAIPIALLIQHWLSRKAFALPVLAFIALAISLNLLQAYQYHKGIIHPDAMNKAKYWHVFGKTGTDYQNIFGGVPELVYGGLDDYETKQYFLDMESPTEPWSFTGITVNFDAYSGKKVAQLNENLEYSPTLILESEHLRITHEPVYVKVNLSYREFEPNQALDALLVYAATNARNELIFYKTFKIKDMPDFRIGVWKKPNFGFFVPAWTDELSQVKIYVWNRAKKTFQIDDFEVMLHFPEN